MVKVLLIAIAVIAILVFLKFLFGGKKRQPVFLSGITLSESGGFRHKYVDLGLPSGKLWATCNVGANKPTEYGDYFAWGEVKPKDEYSWDNYKFISSYLGDNDEDVNDVSDYLTKYVVDNEEEHQSKPDNLMTLEPTDDAANANWGDSWSMPTKQDFEELRDNCKWQWTDNLNDSGVAGLLGTSNVNGKTIFFPAADSREKDVPTAIGFECYYWSSSLCEDDSDEGYLFDSGPSINAASADIDIFGDFRSSGLTVRPVVNKSVETV